MKAHEKQIPISSFAWASRWRWAGRETWAEMRRRLPRCHAARG